MYIGQTRSRRLIAELSAHKFGEMTQPGEWPPKRTPCAADNGAFKVWRAGGTFNASKFLLHIARILRDGPCPDFVVVPDIPMNGAASLQLSLSWVPKLQGTIPLYLVVQNGMEPTHISDLLEPFAGIFVGGDVPWKLRTGSAWVRLAHRHGRRCHIGRVGTAKRVRWARCVGADSIDSCLPLWSAQQLQRFVAALIGVQMDLTGV